MNKIKVVFFDWGGVVADDPGDDFLRDMMRRAGVSEEKVDTILGSEMKEFMCGQISNDEFWQRVERASDVKVPAELRNRYTDWPGLIANENVLHFADKLRLQGIKTAILSNVIEPSYRVIKEAGYYEHFDAVFASCKIGFAKPDQEIYTAALAGMQCEPAEAVFIDDKQRSLDPAATLGMITILARDPEQIVRDTLHAMRSTPFAR